LIQFPNVPAYAAANYGHFCTTLLGFFSFSFYLKYFGGVGKGGGGVKILHPVIFIWGSAGCTGNLILAPKD